MEFFPCGCWAFLCLHTQGKGRHTNQIEDDPLFWEIHLISKINKKLKNTWLSSDFTPQLSGSLRQNFREETSHGGGKGAQGSSSREQSPLQSCPGPGWSLAAGSAGCSGRWEVDFDRGVRFECAGGKVHSETFMSPNVSLTRSQQLTGRGLPELTL